MKTGPATANAGDTVTYVITTSNAGPSTAAAVVVTDTLPTGATFADANRSAAHAAGVVAWPSLATLASGSTQVDTVRVIAPASGTMTNVTAVTSTTADPDATNNADTATTAVTAQADVQIVKAGPATANAGDTVTYVVTISNAGPSTAAAVVVTDTLPTGATFVDANRSAAHSAGVVTWPSLATLASGSTQVDTVRVIAPASGTMTNVTAVTSTTADPDATNNVDTATTAVTEQADVQIVKTGPATANAGDTVTYVITTS